MSTGRKVGPMGMLGTRGESWLLGEQGIRVLIEEEQEIMANTPVGHTLHSALCIHDRT